MASFAVRDNQENRAVLSQKQSLLPGVHQKRPALGAIENLNDQNNKVSCEFIAYFPILSYSFNVESLGSGKLY